MATYAHEQFTDTSKPTSSPERPTALMRLADIAKEAALRRSGAFEALSAAEAKSRELSPPVPELIRDPRHPDYPLEELELRRYDRERLSIMSPEQRQRTAGCSATPSIDALREWEAAVELAAVSLGLPQLEEAWLKEERLIHAIADAVGELRPRTLKDAAAKCQVLMIRYGDAKRSLCEAAPFIAFAEELIAAAHFD